MNFEDLSELINEDSILSYQKECDEFFKEREKFNDREKKFEHFSRQVEEHLAEVTEKSIKKHGVEHTFKMIKNLCYNYTFKGTGLSSSCAHLIVAGLKEHKIKFNHYATFGLKIGKVDDIYVSNQCIGVRFYEVPKKFMPPITKNNVIISEDYETRKDVKRLTISIKFDDFDTMKDICDVLKLICFYN